MSEHFLLSKLKSSSSDIKELAKTICIKQIKQFFEEIKTARKNFSKRFSNNRWQKRTFKQQEKFRGEVRP